MSRTPRLPETAMHLWIATWQDGLHVLSDDVRSHELAGRSVRGLACDDRDGLFAIVDQHELAHRSAAGTWTTVARHDDELACIQLVGDALFVGTDSDARLLQLAADDTLQPVAGFHRTEGHDTWFAGTAVVDGQVLGPPLGVRSLSVTCDGAVLLAVVHVGGLPRSTDGGDTWQPTLDVAVDVHEVVAHPTRPQVVIAACAQGLCVSQDAGATWTLETEGLQATYGSAVAFAGDDILLAAASDHFTTEGALYRRALYRRGLDAPGALRLLGGGLPDVLGGIADTGCLAAQQEFVAVVDKRGHLYLSEDAGQHWTQAADDLAGASALLIT